MVQRHGCAQVTFNTNDVDRKFDQKSLMDSQWWKLLPLRMIAGQSLKWKCAEKNMWIWFKWRTLQHHRAGKIYDYLERRWTKSPRIINFKLIMVRFLFSDLMVKFENQMELVPIQFILIEWTLCLSTKRSPAKDIHFVWVLMYKHSKWETKTKSKNKKPYLNECVVIFFN